jgi:hypothetical protein
MRLMDARGRLRTFSIESHPEMMKALMCNLGMMGIMYDITIRVNGTLIAKVQNQFVPLGDLLYNQTNLRETVTSHFLQRYHGIHLILLHRKRKSCFDTTKQF